MITVTTYQCEICLTTFGDAADALRCEAHGLPAPVPWLTLGERMPAFGENGVEWTTIEYVRILRGYRCHEWILDLRCPIAISHNRRNDSCTAYPSDFDPRQGCDAFRYRASAEDIAVWEEAMRRYGFAESEASAWVREHVERARVTLGVKEKGAGR